MVEEVVHEGHELGVVDRAVLVVVCLRWVGGGGGAKETSAHQKSREGRPSPQNVHQPRSPSPPLPPPPQTLCRSSLLWKTLYGTGRGYSLGAAVVDAMGCRRSCDLRVESNPKPYTLNRAGRAPIAAMMALMSLSEIERFFSPRLCSTEPISSIERVPLLSLSAWAKASCMTVLTSSVERPRRKLAPSV